jgi:hypothetical protein
VFIRKSSIDFCIISIYVDDLNIISHTKDIDLGLFFRRNQESDLIGYADAGYLSDPQNGRSQTGFIFLHGETDISWKS